MVADWLTRKHTAQVPCTFNQTGARVNHGSRKEHERVGKAPYRGNGGNWKEVKASKTERETIVSCLE